MAISLKLYMYNETQVTDGFFCFIYLASTNYYNNNTMRTRHFEKNSALPNVIFLFGHTPAIFQVVRKVPSITIFTIGGL